jgi:type III pantothenate kinase
LDFKSANLDNQEIKNFIAVDIGNTTCEFAIFSNNKIITKSYIQSKPLNMEEIKSLGDITSNFKDALFVICSVVKNAGESLKVFLQKEYNATVLLINASSYNLLMKTTGRDVASIGLDIIAKSDWAIANNKSPCIIVDVGTATVVQYIDESGSMDKVAITLGLSSIYKVLNSNTSLLPLVTPKKTHEALGFDTISAMQRGIYWGYIGTINSLISKAINETNCNNIFITGGLSKLILDDLQVKPVHNSNIIFDGIRVILNNNINKVKNNEK